MGEWLAYINDEHSVCKKWSIEGVALGSHKHKTHQSRVHAVEMSYLRGACGVIRWEGESNERCDMGSCANGVKCSAVEWVKQNTLG